MQLNKRQYPIELIAAESDSTELVEVRSQAVSARWLKLEDRERLLAAK